jgi:hypothetical protein
MSASRLPFFETVPAPVRRAFATADHPQSPWELLEREIAARAVLDAVGITGESMPLDHNRAVREARGWFRWSANVEAVFEYAGLRIDNVRAAVLACPPLYKGDADDRAAVLVKQ